MKKMLVRISNAIAFGAASFANPEALSPDNLGLMVKLYDLIFRVQKDGIPLLTHIAVIHPTEEDHVICTLWCGAGKYASPSARIRILIEENANLKEALRRSRHGPK